MKVLFELPLKVNNYQDSRFNWLTNKNDSCLFLIEGGKILRTISASRSPGKELNSATLTDTRTCTSVSWNKSLDKLAIVVDKKLIYIWDNTKNDFSHFKPNHKASNLDTNPSAGNRSDGRPKEINLVCWSKISDKLIICYSSGQLLICNVGINNNSEKFIDNNYGVLKEIVSVESSEFNDLFACITVIFEIMVMSFEGQTKFYMQGEDLLIETAKFSPPIPFESINPESLNNHYQQQQQQNQILIRSINTINAAISNNTINNSGNDKSVWLSYQSFKGRLHFNRIISNGFQQHETSLRGGLVFSSEIELDSHVVQYYWLQWDRLLLCYSSGSIVLLKINSTKLNQQPKRDFTISELRVLNLEPHQNLNQQQQHEQEQQESLKAEADETSSSISSMEINLINIHRDAFKAFNLINHYKNPDKNKDSDGKTHSIAMISNYKLLYYDIIDKGGLSMKLEKVDEVDLSESLRKLNLSLERLDWYYDGSMLAVQLTNGHILVYRTKLQEYMVSTCNSRSAYLSGLNEITVLNFENNVEIQSINGSSRAHNSSYSTSPIQSNQASILNLKLKPSLIAIGPCHLVAALNNRVQFYNLDEMIHQNSKKAEWPSADYTNQIPGLIDEQEYVSIVQAISLNSTFIAVHLSDGRLKLHSIKQTNQLVKFSDSFDERFFPDPSRPETITSFTLCERILVYTTKQMYLRVFSLDSFSMIENCNLSDHGFNIEPIVKLRPNQLGNMIVCFSETNTVYLYDLYSNKMILFKQSEHLQLYEKMNESQLYFHLAQENRFYLHLKQQHRNLHSIDSLKTNKEYETIKTLNERINKTRPDFSKCHDAIWDADGTSLLLIENKLVHTLVVMRHTLATEEALIFYLSSMEKPSSYTTLYASHGIISYQTSLGRVINSILTSHDDEANLIELEHKIASIKEAATKNLKDTKTNKANLADNSNDDMLDWQCSILSLKLDYLDSIVMLYPLGKCRDICDHLISEEQFNLESNIELSSLNQILWRKLAVWALFTLNLKFAQLILQKYGPFSMASVLAEIIDDVSFRGSDAKNIKKRKLLVLSKNMTNQEDLVFTSDEKVPDSWPDEFPGITNFSTIKPSPGLQFDVGDIALVNSLSNLASGELIDEIKTIYKISSELHLEEEREKTRGKILRVLLD